MGRLASPAQLDGISVVAFEQSVAGPLATRMLSDMGADVIKVERPDGGDFSRHWDTRANGLSSYFVWLNRGKRSIAIRPRHPGGPEILQRLIARADVFVINSSPSSVERLGLDYARIRHLNERLVYCAISGYGSSGPYATRKAYDLLIQGEAGLISTTGTEDEPAKIGVSVCDIGAAMFATQAILAGLYQRERTGEGCSVEVSMFDAMLEWLGGPLAAVANGAPGPRREGMRHNMIVPYGPFKTADGRWVNFAVEHNEEWTKFCRDVLEKPTLGDDRRFRSNERRLKNRAILEGLVETEFSARPRAEWIRRLAHADIAYGDVNDLRDVLNHPQVIASGALRTASMNGTEAQIVAPAVAGLRADASRDLPEIGQHTTEVLAELGLRESEISVLLSEGTVA